MKIAAETIKVFLTAFVSSPMQHLTSEMDKNKLSLKKKHNNKHSANIYIWVLGVLDTKNNKLVMFYKFPLV